MEVRTIPERLVRQCDHCLLVYTVKVETSLPPPCPECGTADDPFDPSVEPDSGIFLLAKL